MCLHQVQEDCLFPSDVSLNRTGMNTLNRAVKARPQVPVTVDSIRPGSFLDSGRCNSYRCIELTKFR